MIPAENLKSHFHLHFVVILLGFTAILGNLISLEAIHLVWYRMFFAFIGLLIFFHIKKIRYVLALKDIVRLLGIGIIIALHWIAFFHAINVSNVSVTLGVMASTTLFTSFLEPLINQRRILWLEVIIGLLVIGGLYIIFQFETHYYMGIFFALLAAFSNGIFVVLNKRISLRYEPTVISFYEMIGGFGIITVFYVVTGGIDIAFFQVSTSDLIYILILSFLCTSYAFAAIVEIMKVLSAYNVVLAINMEPVYGIIMALIVFGESERMSPGFYLGATIIIAAVFSYPFLKRKFTSNSLP